MCDGLTGCWGASLRVLKTCATLPRALRCMRKLGRAQRVARLITLQTHTHVQIHHLDNPLVFIIIHHPVMVVKVSLSFRLPKAASVERLAALEACCQVLEVVRELLVLSELHHIVEVLYVLHHCI